jgi:hypothetical protein
MRCGLLVNDKDSKEDDVVKNIVYKEFSKGMAK